MSSRILLILLLTLPLINTAQAETRIKPFILAETVANTNLTALVKTTRQKLKNNKFKILGEYTPYADTHILVITNAELRRQAARSNNGGFGAIQRVAVSKTVTGLQVSYTNPSYLAQAYQMESDLNHITRKLGETLGNKKAFGSKLGLTAKQLRKYQYEMLMPYFDDRLSLAEYETQQQAIRYVENSLRKKIAGVSKVYRLDIPGKQETIIGVQLSGKNKDDCSSDSYIMSRIDFGANKSAAHLPYEILIKNGKIHALFAEFRIAISFPDLNMVGKQSFATIICAPQAIETALVKVAGGTIEW